MLRPFRLHEPTSLSDAVSLLSQYGEEAKIYAGGTELLLAMKERLLRYAHLVNIKTIPGLDHITYERERGLLRLGPTVTHRNLELSSVVQEEFPLIAEVEKKVANIRVRNVGTLGGNLCFAEPHADPGALLLLYNTEVQVQGSGGSRAFPLEDLFVDAYETSLEGDEVLTEVRVPHFPPGMQGAYFKFGYHERPTLGLGVAVRLDGTQGVQEVRVAVGSVGPKPLRAREAEALLEGKTMDEALSRLEEAGDLAARAANPITDLHGSAEYKTHLVKVFLRRAFLLACERARERR